MLGSIQVAKGLSQRNPWVVVGCVQWSPRTPPFRALVLHVAAAAEAEACRMVAQRGPSPPPINANHQASGPWSPAEHEYNIPTGNDEPRVGIGSCGRSFRRKATLYQTTAAGTQEGTSGTGISLRRPVLVGSFSCNYIAAAAKNIPWLVQPPRNGSYSHAESSSSTGLLNNSVALDCPRWINAGRVKTPSNCKISFVGHSVRCAARHHINTCVPFGGSAKVGRIASLASPYVMLCALCRCHVTSQGANGEKKVTWLNSARSRAQ